jgi:hypothetical protein
MNSLLRMHKRFQYRLAGKIGLTKVIFAGKTESQKNKAEAFFKIIIYTDSKL